MAPTIPAIGLGTGGPPPYIQDEVATEAVRSAIDLGYRYVDTAQAYGNEAAVGRGLAASGVDRQELFVATKVRPEYLAYDDVIDSVEASLDDLGLDYLDLLLVHFPAGTYDPPDTFAAFDDLVADGRVSNVGVSNFTVEELEEARRVAESPIVVDQVELHPWCQQPELRAYAREHDLRLIGYSPLIRGQLFEEPVVRAIAEERDLTPAQVGLAWLLGQPNVSVVVKSTDPAHQAENLAAAELTLDEDDVRRIEAIERREKLVDPRQDTTL